MTLLSHKRMVEARLVADMAVHERVRLSLDEFQGLELRYPLEGGEVCRIFHRQEWWLVRGILSGGRLYFSWRRPIIRVKAETRRG